MYLTRVKLDCRNKKTQAALMSHNLFHGAVERSFEPKQKRNLWRIDSLNGGYYLMLLSEIEPQMDNFIRQFCKPGTKAETKEYDKLLNRTENGQYWNFRLVASPTYRQPAARGEKGKITSYNTEQEQKDWLIKKAEKYGFTVNDNSFRVTGKERKLFKKNKDETNRVNMVLVTFEGVLKIVDVTLFREALCSGIGREKAFGAGMLTICR